jgi:hypothetical protein
MAEELEILDLALDLPHHVQALDLLPVQDLDGYLVCVTELLILGPEY